MKAKSLSFIIIALILSFQAQGNLTADDRLAGPVDFIHSPTHRVSGGLY